MTIRVGVLGYGYWGPNLARNIAETDGLCLAAIADERADRRAAAARRHAGVAVADSAASTIDADRIDAVVIATPLSTHFPLARAAIEAGKHVLIDSGELGELLYLDSVRVNLGLFQTDSNVIWDLAAHDLAVMDYLVDERPVSVSANGSSMAGFAHENIAYITVHFANGFLGHFHVNWLAPVKIRQMLLGGRQRMLVYDDMDPREKVRVYDKGVDFFVQDYEARRQILVSYRTGDMYAPKHDRREALSLVTAEFASAIAERREPMTGAAAGIRVVSMLEGAEQSLRNEGRRITI